MSKNRIKLLLLFPLLAIAQEPVVTRKIAVVVDTGISQQINKEYLCEGLSKDFTGYGLTDNNGHGTNVAGIIYRDINPADACLTILKVKNSGYEFNSLDHIIKALDYALKLTPFLVNMSMEGMGTNDQEERLIKQLNAQRTHFVVAAGNLHIDLSKDCNNYPPCYKNNSKYFWVVGGPEDYSNFSGPINAIMPGKNICGFDTCKSGTSQSAAQFSNYLLKNGIK